MNKQKIEQKLSEVLELNIELQDTGEYYILDIKKDMDIDLGANEFEFFAEIKAEMYVSPQEYTGIWLQIKIPK